MRGYELPPEPNPGMYVTVDWGRKIVRCLRQLIPIQTPDMRFDVTQHGTIYKPLGKGGTSAAARETHPFAVRWFPYDENSGEWQIYLPCGCAILNVKGQSSYGGTYNMIPVNRKARNAKGEDIFAWYRIEDPKDSDATIVQEDDRIAKQWTVRLLAKPYPRMMLSTDPKAFDTVSGSVAVATMTLIETRDDEGNTRRSRSGENIVRESQTFEHDVSRAFSVHYRTEDDAKEPDAKFKPSIVNSRFLFSRKQQIVGTETDISGMKDVYVKFGHESEKFTIEVTDQREDSDEDKTVVRIYRLEDDVVTIDERDDLDAVLFIN